MEKTYTYFYQIKKLIYENQNCTKAIIKYFGDCVYQENKLPVRYAEDLEINFDTAKPIVGVDVTEVLTKSWVDAELTDEFINPVKEKLRLKLEKTANKFIEDLARVEAEANEKLPWENTNPEND
jgi:hypothetical protein